LQGIGAALVQAYRKLGWAVVANSRSIEGSNDAGVVTVTGDIADPAVARNVIEVAVREFGRVDTLVNNAGSSSPSRSPTTPPRTTRPWSG
jgi:NAD(P)-dependent dehydrogenase (short-subunit alcohol dehydrogenase family)